MLGPAAFLAALHRPIHNPGRGGTADMNSQVYLAGRIRQSLGNATMNVF
jgi:hypothetical protein